VFQWLLEERRGRGRQGSESKLDRSVDTVGIDRKKDSVVDPVVEERLGLRAGVKSGWRAGRVPIFLELDAH
jgi:hypothetical protein